MVPKLKQTSLDQTGIAIFKLDGSEKVTPLFSLNPTEEAKEMEKAIFHFDCSVELKHVFVANTILDYKIESEIKGFQKIRPNVLPEDMMEELLSGFPFVVGASPYFSPVWYA